MKPSLYILFAAMIFGGSFGAHADRESNAVAWAPPQTSIQMTSDSKYIYFRRPLHLLMDHSQTEALKKASDLVSAQLTNITKQYNPNIDPSGDLNSLVNGVQTFREQIAQLVSFAATVYGTVDAERSQWLPWLGEQADPTGFILFGTIEANKNVLNWLPIPGLSSLVQGGGSLSGAVVFVPMEVTRFPVDGSAAETYTEFDTSFVVIPNINAGLGVTTANMDTNVRGGVGIIWGEMNRASDLIGLTGGGSATVEYPQFAKILPSALQAGVSFKFMALKNPARTGVVNNVIGLVGLEGGATPTWTGTTPLLKLKAQAHLNISYILDANRVFNGLTNSSGSLLRRITGY